MQTFKLGFIGSGSIAHSLATACRQIRGVQIAGVYSPNTANDFAAWIDSCGLGPCQASADIEELCAMSNAVAILGPNHTRVEHIEQITAAVEAGAELDGLICEKPLARTVAEARILVTKARAAGLQTAYFENQIHMKSLKSALGQLASIQASMGPIGLVRSAEEHSGPHSPWFWDPIRQGGGVLLDMACHSIAAAWYALTPIGKPVDFLRPVSIWAETALLKWGQTKALNELLTRMGIDYSKTPAEDFATGLVTFENPETGQKVKAQFTNSWMFDKQGLKLSLEGLGPGYAFDLDSSSSGLHVFISDRAANSTASNGAALEKSTATRGMLTLQANEADLYGFTDELEDAIASFRNGVDGMLSWEYGLEITRLCQAAYLSAEQGKTIDLTDPKVQEHLEGYRSLIAQGRGAEVLL